MGYLGNTFKLLEQSQYKSNITNRMHDPSVSKATNLILKYVKSEENVCDYSSRHIYKDLLKFKEIIHYANIVARDATLN